MKVSYLLGGDTTSMSVYSLHFHIIYYMAINEYVISNWIWWDRVVILFGHTSSDKIPYLQIMNGEISLDFV